MARLDSALLSFLGVLLVHEFAYLTSSLVGYENSIAHGHLKTAWLIGTLFLLGLLARAVLSSLRRRNHDGGNVVHLAASIAGGYLLMEQFERALDGYGALSLLSEPVFWFGLAAAPLVALVLSWTLRSIEDVVSRILDAAVLPDVEIAAVANSLGITSLLVSHTPALSTVVSRRGPPGI